MRCSRLYCGRGGALLGALCSLAWPACIRLASSRCEQCKHKCDLVPLGLSTSCGLPVLQGRALEGPVYAAAKKAAHMQPLNPAAQNVLGLASGE